MTTKYDSENNRPLDRPESDRYAAFTAELGVVVYDTKNNAAWLESDAAVELDEMR